MGAITHDAWKEDEIRNSPRFILFFIHALFALLLIRRQRIVLVYKGWTNWIHFLGCKDRGTSRNTSLDRPRNQLRTQIKTSRLVKNDIAAATHPIYTYTNNYCVCVRVFDCLRWTIRSFSLRVCFYPYVVKRSLNSGENVQLSLSFAVVVVDWKREKKKSESRLKSSRSRSSGHSLLF